MDCKNNLEYVPMPGRAFRARPPSKFKGITLQGQRAINIDRIYVVDQNDGSIMSTGERIAKVAKRLLETVQAIKENDVEFFRAVALGKIPVRRKRVEFDAFLLEFRDLKIELGIHGDFPVELQAVESPSPGNAYLQIAASAHVLCNSVETPKCVAS